MGLAEGNGGYATTTRRFDVIEKCRLTNEEVPSRVLDNSQLVFHIFGFIQTCNTVCHERGRRRPFSLNKNETNRQET